jgi:hypothetical protein
VTFCCFAFGFDVFFKKLCKFNFFLGDKERIFADFTEILRTGLCGFSTFNFREKCYFWSIERIFVFFFPHPARRFKTSIPSLIRLIKLVEFIEPEFCV